MPRRDLGDRPLVSVVIPTYNRERLLTEAIESVLAQDYPNLELIVVDDGSSDATPAVLERFAEAHPDRFRGLSHENLGQARSLNRGFELARGELLGDLNDDNVLLPGATSKLVAALEASPEAVVAYPGYEWTDDRLQVIDTITPREFSLSESLRLHDCMVGPGALFRRAVIDEVGGWDPSFRYCPDWDFWLRAATVGRFVCVPEPLACYRGHREMLGRAGKGLDMAQEHIRLVDLAYSRNPDSRALAEIRDEAYRNAYIGAADSAAPDGPGQRFYIADRLRQRVSKVAKEEDLEARIADLTAWNRHFEAEYPRMQDALARMEQAIEERDAHIRELERLVHILRGPWWRRAAWAVTPARARAWAGRSRWLRGRLKSRPDDPREST
jgi:glycosyltransferase involved in cell wall biosynthesis